MLLSTFLLPRRLVTSKFRQLVSSLIRNKSNNSLYWTRGLCIPVDHNNDTLTQLSLTNKDTLSIEQYKNLSGDQTNVEEARPDNDIHSLDLTCNGCGTSLHCSKPMTQGYIPPAKLTSLSQQVRSLSEQEDGGVVVVPPICQRCFYLKHYNTALDVTLPPDEYKTHLSHLKDKRALILCIVDVTDYPSSLFPSLHSILGPYSTVYLIANKIDLFPSMSTKTRNLFQSYLLREANKSLIDIEVSRVEFVSAKTTHGLDKLTDAIVNDWGNRGDVYLLGCTNVGKSSLFNYLLGSLCGVKPGQAKTMNHIPAPLPTVSHWPGTTLGLLRFPIMSIGKRRRLNQQAMKQEKSLEEVLFDKEEDIIENDFTEASYAKGFKATPSSVESNSLPSDLAEIADVLEKIGLKRVRTPKREPSEPTVPQNRHWLNDTPGAVNDTQIINHLTTKELNLVLPKKPLSPHTFILKPGQTLFIGGLARLDYIEGNVSALFTVFTSSYLPLHTTRTDKADELYHRNLGKPLLKIPAGDSERLDHFPPLLSMDFVITGIGWKGCTSDIILSSAGWVGVTVGEEETVKVMAHTPNGKGMFLRNPSIFPDSVTQRGKRSEKGNRTVFKGKTKKSK